MPPEQSQGRWGFILIVADSLESAKASFDQGLDLMATGNLRPSHEKAWKELWLQSKLEVLGSETLLKALIGCMFYLLSAFPSIHDTSSSFGGVSPGGLSNGGDGQDYWGHVFWDQVRLMLILLFLGFFGWWCDTVSVPSLDRTSGCILASPCSTQS